MYIDPSSGGMLFQISAVLFALISGMILLYASKIRMLLSRAGRYLRERAANQDKPAQPVSDKSDEDQS